GRRKVRDAVAEDKAVAFEPAKCELQHALGNTADRAPQLVEAERPVAEPGNDQHRPFVAAPGEHVADLAAIRRQMRVTGFHRCAFLHAACPGTYLASVINLNQRIGAMAKLNLAVVVGSNRRDSINRKLAHALARLSAGSFEATFVRIDDLPMFNQDLEGSLPAEVVRYKGELARADAVLIVTPEHDRSIPAVLKTAR